MKFSLRALSLVSCSAILMAAAGTASAGTINGTVYYNIPAPSATNPQGQSYAINGVDANSLSTVESGLLYNTFTTNTVNFTTGPGQGPSTFYNFLGITVPPAAPANPNGVAFTGGTGNPAAASATGNLIVLTGTVFLTSGATYDLFHDDGINLYIAPLGTTTYTDANDDVESEQGQTVAGTPGNVDGQDFMWSGASGYYDFELIYVSNYEDPSTLIAGSNLNSNLGATPEPSSFILLGSGLLAAAGMIRRRMTV